MLKKPTIICVGTAKSGTTSLAEVLKQRGDIFLPEYKEAHFFDYSKEYENGFDYYMETHFPTKKTYGYEHLADFTPSYIIEEKIIERISKCLGNRIKIIIMLRDPVERAYSQYMMNVRRGLESLSFREALEAEEKRVGISERSKFLYSYRKRSCYDEQIANVLQHYSLNNICIIKFKEEFLSNFKETMRAIDEFLGLESFEYTLPKSNAYVEPKHKLFNSFMNKDIIRKSLKRFIPSYSLRRKLGRFYKSMTTKESVYKKLTASERSELFNLYFRESIVKLERQFPNEFQSWLQKYNQD